MAQKTAAPTRRKKKKPVHPTAPPTPDPVSPGRPGPIDPGDAMFAQPTSTPDPTSFTVAHGSDDALYNLVNKKLLQPIPPPRTTDPTLTLAEVWGSVGAQVEKNVTKAKQLVFHAVGDTGSVKGPETQSLVADKMVDDFTDPQPQDRPSFLFHLGDVVYSFGESEYYYDQFYDSYRSYPAPILAVAGNHDGEVYSGDTETSLEAFLRNFCNEKPVKTPESGALVRTAMIQPGVYFTFATPLITLIGLYSNVLEDPGVISSEGDKSSPVTDDQIKFLATALSAAKSARKPVIIVTHHPPFTAGTSHGGSPKMLADIDAACKKAGLWPHAHLSGHAHNYQRFTRAIGGFEIPYLICGNGGHGLDAIQAAKGVALRTPFQVSKTVTLESYTDKDYGYLRIVVDSAQIRIEFHDASTGAKTPTDVVAIDIASHKMVAS